MQKTVQELRLPSAEGLSCSTVSGLVTAILGTSRDANSSRKNRGLNRIKDAPPKPLEKFLITGMALGCIWEWHWDSWPCIKTRDGRGDLLWLHFPSWFLYSMITKIILLPRQWLPSSLCCNSGRNTVTTGRNALPFCSIWKSDYFSFLSYQGKGNVFLV